MAANITEDAIAKALDRFPNLETVIVRKMWPTPSRIDGDFSGMKQETAASRFGVKQITLATCVQAAIGGSLNPDWVELLMGWPKGWTSLNALDDGTIPGWGDGWEDGVPRVATGVQAMVHRLKAIGNGQVPQCAAEAWRLLTS